MKHASFKELLIMAGLHFLLMYFAMFSMVNTLDNIYLGINQAYMAALMTAPMLILEVIVMRSMYEKKTINIFLVISSIVLLSSFIFIRKQTLIEDKEFIRSMIPHHSGAILMCDKADINDTELKELCKSISKAQREEIDQMENILLRLNSR